MRLTPSADPCVLPTEDYARLRMQFEAAPAVRANLDALTGLADRSLFEGRLALARARSRREGRHYAVLLLDIDGFQAINDAVGAAAGDILLRQFARRLKAAFRHTDTIARFKDEDFAILVEGLAAISNGELVAARIIGLLATPFQVAGRAIRLEASIGIASCAAGEEIAGSLLLRQAGAAMHGAKLLPGSACRSFVGLLDHLARSSAAMRD